MDSAHTIKSDIQQGTAEWVAYLKQLRLARIHEALSNQDFNLIKSLHEIDRARFDIESLIVDRNRGSQRGMHGFIAEIAENGIRNAKSQVSQGASFSFWADDNGRDDLYLHGEALQQKFVQSGNRLSLNAVVAHLNKYPEFIKKGGKYIIPKDYYEKIIHLFQLSPEDAGKLARKDYNLWKYVHATLDGKKLSIDDLIPSALTYSESQKGAYAVKLDAVEKEVRKENREIKKEIQGKNRPSFKEGATATVISAGIEAGAAFATALIKKRKERGSIKDITNEDWKEILTQTGFGAVTGGSRGGLVYLVTNKNWAPAALASSLVTCSAGIANNYYLYKKGKITEKERNDKMFEVCADSTVSAISSLLGQVMIPIPVFGTIIGNTVGNFIYQTAKDCFGTEMKLAEWYSESVRQKSQKLGAEYKELVSVIDTGLSTFTSLVKDAYCDDCLAAFRASGKLAVELKAEEPLLSREARDRYFCS